MSIEHEKTPLDSGANVRFSAALESLTDGLRKVDAGLYWSIPVADTKDIELQVMSALAAVMDRFNELGTDSDGITDVYTQQRIAQWFQGRYGN